MEDKLINKINRYLIAVMLLSISIPLLLAIVIFTLTFIDSNPLIWGTIFGTGNVITVLFGGHAIRLRREIKNRGPFTL